MAKERSPAKNFTIPASVGENYQQNVPIEQLPDTIREALGTKRSPYSLENAIEKVNPFHSYDYSEYSENCQRCVVAYEMRRRGYDVEAQPTYKNDPWPVGRVINGVSMGRWRGAFRHAVTERVGVRGNTSAAENKVFNNLRDKMLKYGNGSRAVINIRYRGRDFGHVFNVENRGGRIHFVDAQTGERYSNADMHSLLHIVETNSVGITRTDNLRVSNRITNFVWQNHEKRRK